MTQSQWMILAILAATLCLFLYGRWRHDIVAATALLASVLVGLVPAGEAFAGFAHPAVITVACVLILSSALLQTGVVDMLAERLLPTKAGPLMAVAIGASAAFLTPIGHQNNTLLLGPGGFRFGDYWRMGLPLKIVVTLISIPMLLLVWPL